MKYLLIILSLFLAGCHNTLWECTDHTPSHVINDKYYATQTYGCKTFKPYPPASYIPESRVPASTDTYKDDDYETITSGSITGLGFPTEVAAGIWNAQ